MSSGSFGSLCDDFYIDMHVNTELELPSARDTILAFFERIERQYPTMTSFYRRRNDDYCLEEDQQIGQYRWVALESDRVASGYVNPPSFEDAYDQDRLILELIPYMLGVSHLDVDSLDVTFGMDFDYFGSHDEVIAEALLAGSAFGTLFDIEGASAMGFSPAAVISLSDNEFTQARLCVESKTSVLEPRKKSQSQDSAISLALTVRQYPRLNEKFDSLKSFENQCRLVEELMAEKVVPEFVQRLTEVIAQKRST